MRLEDTGYAGGKGFMFAGAGCAGLKIPRWCWLDIMGVLTRRHYDLQPLM